MHLRQLTTLVHGNASGELARFAYTYDTGGRRTGKTISGAGAIGRAENASVRIEEFRAEAETPTDRDRAETLARDNAAMLRELRLIRQTLDGLRTDASEGGQKANRLNIILAGGGWVLGGVAILVAILIAMRVIR